MHFWKLKSRGVRLSLVSGLQAGRDLIQQRGDLTTSGRIEETFEAKVASVFVELEQALRAYPHLEVAARECAEVSSHYAEVARYLPQIVHPV